jgi:hypothetical protein
MNADYEAKLEVAMSVLDINVMRDAAPDLYEALLDLVELVKDDYQYNDIAVTRSLHNARAALAIARGES